MHLHSEVAPGCCAVDPGARESTKAREKRLSRAITMVQVRSLEMAEVTNGEHITVRSEPS